MIIKSHIRGGYRAAAQYLKEQGQNEKTRLVEISDPAAKNLDEAFYNMWAVASDTRCTKPLHHISINPMKDERLTEAQLMAIVQRCEEKYGYKMFHHQRVIVEHIKDGRQHFHVIWNRVSLYTGKPVWPGHHWKKSKQVCREMEKELGLKRPATRGSRGQSERKATIRKAAKQHHLLKKPPKKVVPMTMPEIPPLLIQKLGELAAKNSFSRIPAKRGGKRGKDENKPDSEKIPVRRAEMDSAELLAWAWENCRLDVLAQFGIILPSDYFEP